MPINQPKEAPSKAEVKYFQLESYFQTITPQLQTHQIPYIYNVRAKLYTVLKIKLTVNIIYLIKTSSKIYYLIYHVIQWFLKEMRASSKIEEQ